MCVVGFSGTGKTLLCEYLVKRFRRNGTRVGAVKHARHDLELDKRGKDTWRMTEAGASLVFAVSRSKVIVVDSLVGDHGGLEFAIRLCREAGLGAVVIEGFKSRPPEGSTLVVTANRPDELASLLRATGGAPAAVATLGRKSALAADSTAPVFSLRTEKEKIFRAVCGV